MQSKRSSDSGRDGHARRVELPGDASLRGDAAPARRGGHWRRSGFLSPAELPKRPRRFHVAILKPRYVELIRGGRKTIESRLTVTRRAPFGQIDVGERIYFKVSSGPFRLIAKVAHVQQHHPVTPELLDRLEQQYDRSILGGPEYWRSKRQCHYAVLIELGLVEPAPIAPSCYEKSQGLAWFCYDAARDPIIDLRITEAAIRNRYLRVPKWVAQVPTGPACLRLPDGRVIQTQVNANRCFRWRQWGQVYRDANVEPGGIVRLIARSPGTYDVVFPEL